MKNVYDGLNYFGFMCTVMFNIGFIFRFVFHDIISLDQLLGIGIGITILLTTFFIKLYENQKGEEV